MKKYLTLVAILLSTSTAVNAEEATTTTPKSIFHERNQELRQNWQGRKTDLRDNRIEAKEVWQNPDATKEEKKDAKQDFRADRKDINQQYHESGKDIRQDYRGDMRDWKQENPDSHSGVSHDRREDFRDGREDVRDHREDVRDRREDRWDATHGNNGPSDRAEDRRDAREDVRDRREDVRDRREGRFDRKHGPSRRR